MASAFSFNPQAWKSVNPKDPRALTRFLQELGDTTLQMQNLLTQLQSAPFLAGILNGTGLLTSGSAQTVFGGFGSVSTNQSVECAGATAVFVSLTITASITLTLAHLSTSQVPVMIRPANGTAGALTVTLAVTNPSGTAYSFIQGMNSTDTLINNLALPASVQRTAYGMTAGLSNGWLNFLYL